MPRGRLEMSPSFRVALSGGASSSSPLFTQLYEGALTSAAPDLLQSKRAAQLIPATYFAASLAEFDLQLKAYVSSRGIPAGTRAVLLVDGAPKRLAGSGQAAEDFVRDALAAAGLAPAPAPLDVPRLVGAEGAAFHASVSVAAALEATVRQNEGAVLVVLARRAVLDAVKAAAAAARFEGHLLAVPPALSGSACTSAFSSLEEDGVAKTSRTRAPSAAFWLLPLLALAPLRLARQGFAVATAFSLAGADWLIGFKLHVVEGYSEAVHRMVAPALAALRERAPELGAAKEGEPLPAGVAAALAAALSMAGVACNVASTTTPGSGFEHAAAHALAFLRAAAGRPAPPHGEAVAVCATAAARALDFLLDLPAFDPARFRSLAQEDTARGVLSELQARPYGPAAGSALEKAASYHAAQAWRKERKWKEMRLEEFAGFAKEWAATRRRLREAAPRAAELRVTLAAAGLPTGPGAGVAEAELAWSLRFAPFVRHRFNTSNLIRWLGFDPAEAAGLAAAAPAPAAPLAISVRLPSSAFEEGAASSPSPHFRLFYQALAYEDVLGDRYARLIPAQYYADSLEEFAGQVASYAARRGWSRRRFIILTDGIRKKVAGSEAAADDAVRDALRAAGLDALLEDVCGVCGVSAAALAASADHLPKLEALVARERDSVLLCFSKGAVCDLMKHAILQSKLDVPLLVVPPALTVTAFTSAFAVIDYSGAKRTLMSLAPTATFWLAPVLRMAPAFVNRAGFGDLLAGLLANGDWYLGFKMQARGPLSRPYPGPASRCSTSTTSWRTASCARSWPRCGRRRRASGGRAPCRPTCAPRRRRRSPCRASSCPSPPPPRPSPASSTSSRTRSTTSASRPARRPPSTAPRWRWRAWPRPAPSTGCSPSTTPRHSSRRAGPRPRPPRRPTPAPASTRCSPRRRSSAAPPPRRRGPSTTPSRPRWRRARRTLRGSTRARPPAGAPSARAGRGRRCGRRGPTSASALRA